MSFQTLEHSKPAMGHVLHETQGSMVYQGESIRMLEESGGATLDPTRRSGELVTLEDTSQCHS